jgi:hypothetical protein
VADPTEPDTVSGLSEQEREQAPMTLADVGELVGDDISFWLNNAFMTPDMIAGKVLWWISRAQAAAREEAAAKVEAVEALADKWAEVLAECKASDPRWILDRSVTTLETAHRELREVLDGRITAADIRKGDDRG